MGLRVRGENLASMKALPKRKGNCHSAWNNQKRGACLNEAPPKRKGNLLTGTLMTHERRASMKALPKRKGKAAAPAESIDDVLPQ